jgi:hypothetical protein
MADKARAPDHPHYAMRWEWVRFVMSRPAPVTSSEKALAWQIAYAVNRKSGHAFPSQRLLALRSGGISDRQVRTILKNMERHGLVKDLRPGGGRTADGSGRSGEYQLLMMDRVASALAELAKLEVGEAGTKPPGKAGTTLPGKAGSDTPPNPEVGGGEPGSASAPTRNDSSDNLKADLKPTITDLKDGKRTSSEADFVRRASNDDMAFVYVSREILRILRHDTDRHDNRVGDQYVDRWVMSQLPQAVYENLIRQCRAGTLERATVQQAVDAAGIPAFEVSRVTDAEVSA